MKNEMENTAETPETITPADEKRVSQRLGIKEFIITLIIIIVVWAARKCFSANRFTGDVPSLHQPPVMTAAIPESSKVIENVIIIYSTDIGAQFGTEYSMLFQQALEVDYAEKDN